MKYVAFKGSLDFSRKYFFNSSRNSITWGIDYTTFYGKDRLVNPTLSDKQSKLLKSSPEKFISEYGREYVSSKTNGIKISVLYQFESTKKEEVDEMNSSLSAFFKGGSVSAEFESKLKSLYNSQKLNIFLSNQGGGKLPTELAFCELSKVKDILKKYLDDAIAINKSVCLEYSTSYYPGLPDKYKSTEPELTIQEKYYENYYKVNSEKNILYTFVHQIPKPSDAVLNEFKIYDQIDKRDNFIHDMNIAAKNYMLFPNDNTKYSSLDDILKKAERLEQVNLPPLPKIWSVNFSQVLQRGETTVTQTLKNLPQTETINIAMEGGVFPKDASSTGQYEIAFRVYVNDRAVWWDEFHSDPDNNAQKVSRNIPIPYPDNGNAEIRIEYADCIQGQGGGKPFNLGITFSVRQ
ncbi:MAG TPA: hypothetical protein PLM27_13945 [Chitinophagales bacterium]|nr:hypothetical protein [Chitinophagales bacterium]